jgi:tetratricopeptide (TPR) repeat protein
MNINKAIQSAYENHRKGNLKQAQYSYQKILKEQPDNPDILHMLGVLCCQLEDYDSAIKYIRKALRFSPAHSEAYCNLGVALQKKGQLDEAITHYQKAIELNQSFDKAHCNLGNALQEKGHLDEAVAHYQKAIELNPSFAKAYSSLGNALREKGQLDEAMTFCKKAIDIDPSFAEAYCNMGVALRERGQLDKAITYYQKAIELNPSFAEAHCNLGNALREKGHLDEAVAHYQKAIALNPSFTKAYSSLGNALREKGQLDEAMTFCKKAIELNPKSAEAYGNLGNVLQEKGLLDEAIIYYQEALELNPSFAEAYCNLGNISYEKGQLDESIIYYQKALEISPRSEAANFNMSLPLLLSGNFKDGWEKYEQRWKAKDFLRKSGFHEPGEFSQPAWDGSSLEGKSIFIYSEQGIGDEIMFASCFQEVIEQADVCTVECDKRLIPIFSRSFPGGIFIEHIKKSDTYSYELPQTDIVIPHGSLPKFLRTDVGAFPRKSYLVPDADKVQAWRNRLKTLGDGLTVGISWRGGRILRVKRTRSIMLEQWAKIFSLSGFHYINLQYGDCKEELKEVKEKLGITIHDWEDADPLKDLDDFAAQIAALDLIISVDNSTVHMAGSLGKPVWVLLPFVPDWRWMLNRDDSPWYPNMRLFRQPSPGDWESVIARIVKELRIYGVVY